MKNPDELIGSRLVTHCFNKPRHRVASKNYERHRNFVTAVFLKKVTWRSFGTLLHPQRCNAVSYSSGRNFAADCVRRYNCRVT